MKSSKLVAIVTLLALLLVPAAIFAQEQKAPEHGVIEFGFRGVAGDVYGRQAGKPGTLFTNGFRPDLLQSPLNTYSDYRNSFYIPRFDAHIDNVFGSNNYLTAKSASNGFAFEGGGALQRDLSALISFGQYGHYKLQFRYDTMPHIFSGTTRSLFTSGGSGIWTLDPTLQDRVFHTICNPNAAFTSCGTVSVSTIANTLTNASNGGLVTNVAGVQQFTQQENRRTIGGSMRWNVNSNVGLFALASREHQTGTRPIGFVMGNGSTGYATEAPEVLNYYTDTVRAGTELTWKNWDALFGYQGSFFHNGTPSMVVSNPFSNVYTISAVGPATGRMDLYPDNQFHQFVSEGAFTLGKYVNFMANITPGFLRQTAQFQPLTTNTAIDTSTPAGYPAFVPESNLNGKVDTLAMNYTAVFKPAKSFKIAAKFQYYDYSDNTEDMLIRPVIADTAWMSFRGAPGAWIDPVIGPSSSLTDMTSSGAKYYLPAEHSSFTNKLFDLGGTWFFTKKNSVKLGYQRGWVDRQHREVAESIEDTVYGALDMQLHKTLSLRISGRHQNRDPQEYEFASGDYYARMVDQTTRVRNRGDMQLSWDPTQRLNIYGFWGTLQDNFNQKGGINSTLPLGDASISPVLIAGTRPTPIYGPYYAYGVLNGIGRNFGAGANFAVSSKAVLFAEYAREKNTGVFVQGRGFDPSSPCTRTSIPVTLRDAAGVPGVAYSGTGSEARNCDPINDLFQSNKDTVNSYYGGVDFTTKKLDLSVYYSLSDGQSFAFADGVNCQIGTNGPNNFCGTHFANWKLDYLSVAASSSTPIATTAADPNRTYYAYGTKDAGGFGFPRSVYRLHDVGVVARFKLTDNFIPKIQYLFRQNDYNDWQTSMVNPYNFVGGGYSFASTATEPLGNSALQKMLLLGADNPSYRAHIVSFTLEYHF